METFANKTVRIKHLKELLKARKEEYACFGACSADMEYDNEIKKEIKKLEEDLK